MKIKDEKIKVIKEILKELFGLLKTPVEFEIKKGEDEIYQVEMKTEEAGILIGSHGETLRSIKHFLVLCLFKKFNQWVNIFIDINGYWKKREKELREMAQEVAGRVIATGESVHLPFLTASERRIIHLALTSHPQVFSESEGEGKMRRLVIKPRS